jgi:ribosome-binding factor A
MEFKRSDRVADLLRREIAELLYQGVKDPRVGSATIIDAEVSADLRHARIFYYVRGDEVKRREVAQGLEKARGFIRRELGKRLRLKHLPELEFRFDSSLDHGARIDKLLKELNKDG